MADEQVQQPMILVKKPDGTSVRVPLSSLQGGKVSVEKVEDSGEGIKIERSKDYEKTSGDIVNIQSVSSSVQTTSPVLLSDSYVEDEESLIKINDTAQSIDVKSGLVGAPLSPINNEKNRAIAGNVLSREKVEEKGKKMEQKINKGQSWSADDHVSLLSEQVEGGVHEVSAIRGDEQIITFLRTCPVVIDTEFQGRAVALLSSFVKGVRTRDQLLQYATKDTAVGGLQLSPVDAQLLVQSVETYFHLASVSKLDKGSTSSFYKQEEKKVMVGNTKNTNTTPILPINPPLAGVRPHIGDIIAPAIQIPREVPSERNLVVEKNIPSKDRPTGPVEEMSTFTKEDFRRLNQDAQAAAKILLEQVENARIESPFLGLSVQRAWFHSPLYQEYVDMLTQSLVEEVTIQELSRGLGVDALRLDEVEAILEINRSCEEV